MLLTYGGGPTTDYAKGMFDVPATIILDGGFYRLAIEEVEKIFCQSLQARPLGAGDSPPLSLRLCCVYASQRLSPAGTYAWRR